MRHSNESGRSMVEMLGVLAIIGVLSVGGIIGLRQALTNARANDLIYEANKRATVVSGQLMFSNGTPSLNEFVQNEFSFGTFNSVTPSNGTFSISINGVSEAVCTKAQSMVSGMIVNFAPQACSGGDNTVLLTYNNDLSENAASGSGDTHGPTEWDGPLADDDSDCSGQTRQGECQVCKDGLYIDSDAVCLSHGKNTCIDGVCTTFQTNCMSNGDCVTVNPSQCGNGECYCNFWGNVDTCAGPRSPGTCVLKSLSVKFTNDVENHTYIVGTDSQSPLDWWSARNFCAAYGKRMMTIEELGCENASSCTSNEAIFNKIRKVRSGTWTADVLSNCQARYVRAGQAVSSFARGVMDSEVFCY